MNAPQTFSPNFRLLPKEQPAVPEDTESQPDGPWTPARSLTGTILAGQPGLAYLFGGEEFRPPTEDELQQSQARREDPQWRWLYVLAGEVQPYPADQPYPAAAPESSGTPRPYISSDGVIVTSTAVPASSPVMTVSTVPASSQTLEAAETVKAAASPPAQEAGDPVEPGPVTQVMDAASMHTQTMTAITPAVGGDGE